MFLPKSCALEEGSSALIGDEHAKDANKITFEKSLFCLKNSRCLLDDFGKMNTDRILFKGNTLINFVTN